MQCLPVVLCLLFPGSGPVTIRCGEDLAEIGNQYLVRTLATRPRLATQSITNRLSGRRFSASGEEFVLGLADGSELPAGQFRVEKVGSDPHAGTLSFELSHEPTGIRATLTYELKPDWFFLRKRLLLQSESRVVRSVDVERLRLGGARLAPLRRDALNAAPVEPAPSPPQRIPKPSIWDIGLGQPVFAADELFLGLEHPAGHNGYQPDGTILLRHYPGRAGRIECKSAVLGVAANRPHQRAVDAFLRYVDQLRRRPVQRFTEFFFDSHAFDAEARQIVDTAREVFVRRGVKLDYVAMMFPLGPQIAEYILALPELSAENRDDLAAVHRWGLARDAWLLADTRPVGGDPMRGEAYGFCHIGPGNRGVIGLRNPTVFERSVTLVCDEKLGFWPSTERFALTATYPFHRAEPRWFHYGDALEVRLGGRELRVLEVAAQAELERPITLGCREQLVEQGAQRTVISLLGGCARTVRLASPVPLAEVRLDGRPCPVEPNAREAEIPLDGPQPIALAPHVSRLQTRPTGDELRISLAADTAGATCCDLLLAFTALRAGMPRLSATIRAGDKDLDVEAPHLYLRDSEGRRGGKHAAAPDWALFRAKLPPGVSDIDCRVRAAGSEPWQGQLQVLLNVARPLPETHRLEIRHAGLPRAPLAPLPAHWNGVESGSLLVGSESVSVGNESL